MKDKTKEKKNRKQIKVPDLKPTKDAKGGRQTPQAWPPGPTRK
jgi:hypothetical protein